MNYTATGLPLGVDVVYIVVAQEGIEPGAYLQGYIAYSNVASSAPPDFNIVNLLAQLEDPMPRKPAPKPPPVPSADPNELDKTVADDPRTMLNIMVDQALQRVGGRLPGKGSITLSETEIGAAASAWQPAMNSVRTKIESKLGAMGYKGVQIETKLHLG